MFTRRHYKIIADVLKNNRSEGGYSEGATDRIIMDFSNLFKADNPRFDQDRFLDACQYGSDSKSLEVK